MRCEFITKVQKNENEQKVHTHFHCIFQMCHRIVNTTNNQFYSGMQTIFNAKQLETISRII